VLIADMIFWSRFPAKGEVYALMHHTAHGRNRRTPDRSYFPTASGDDKDGNAGVIFHAADHLDSAAIANVHPHIIYGRYLSPVYMTFFPCSVCTAAGKCD